MAKPSTQKSAKAAAQRDCLLRSAFLSLSFNHPLTDSEFDALATAREFLSDYTQFEESLLQVLRACEEFESFLLTTALNHYLFPLAKNEVIQDTRLRSNLKVLGFLNSMTSFRDQFPQFKALKPTLNLRDKFRQLWQAQQTNSLAFSFCEHFRNYAQHQTQPVSSVTIGGAWDKDHLLLENNVSVYVSVDAVCKKHEIKAHERNSYKSAFGERCDISLIFRETMGCIGKITKAFREATNTEFGTAIAEYEKNLTIIEKYKPGLIAAEAVSIIGGNETKKFSVFKDFSERAKSLRRTHVAENNHDHFISNRARGHKAKP